MSLSFADSAGYLIDLDGTLISGRTVLPDAQWLLGATAGRFMLVSNNSEHTPQQLVRNLRHMGLQVRPEQVVLAGTAAIDMIARDAPGARLLLLGSMSLRAYARKLGLLLADADADVVLVARDRQFSYARLAAAAEAIHRGARMIAACPDRCHPGVRGQPVPEAGAIAAAVAAAAGVERYEIVGKPQPFLFETAFARLGIKARDAVMIGDNTETDGAGAMRLGMRFVHVRDGHIRSGLEHQLQLAG